MKHGECFPPVFVVRSRRDDSFTATVSSRAADPGDIRAAQAAALQQRGSDGFDLIPVPEQQRMDLRPQAFDLGVGNIIARLQLCLIWRTSPLASASPNLMRSASGPARQTQILSSTLERRSRYSPRSIRSLLISSAVATTAWPSTPSPFGTIVAQLEHASTHSMRRLVDRYSR
jgi:hypothetical protein